MGSLTPARRPLLWGQWGNWGERAPTSHMASSRWVVAGPPTSRMRGAGGRGEQASSWRDPRARAGCRSRVTGAAVTTDSPLGRNTHCYGGGSCRLLWTRDCRPPGLAWGANGPQRRGPHPRLAQPVSTLWSWHRGCPASVGSEGGQGWGPPGDPLRTSGPQVQPPAAKPGCVPPPGWEGPEKCLNNSRFREKKSLLRLRDGNKDS